MARERYRDEDDDYPPPPARPSTSPVLIIALIAGGLLVVGLVACGFIGLWAFRVAPQPAGQPAAVVDDPPAEAQPTATRVWTRAEFKERVMGKTADEVIAAVGTPDHTAVDEFGTFWHYHGRTADPLTGKTDPDTRLEFKQGRVSEVNF